MGVTEAESALIQLDARTREEDSGLTSIAMHMKTITLFSKW